MGVEYINRERGVYWFENGIYSLVDKVILGCFGD